MKGAGGAAHRSTPTSPATQRVTVGPVAALFFCSGLSGLIYQVTWVREFGTVFGNTVYSASLVVAVFMLGLGLGSYAIGRWADRRVAAHPESLLRAYGVAELAIAALAAVVTAILPHLDWMSVAGASYTPGANGWHFLAAQSYVSRAGIAVALLLPVTVVMGGTLTLLIRHLVGRGVETSAQRAAWLYGVNTCGAAIGCVSTDVLLVPAMGLRATQGVAIALNVVAGLGALALPTRASQVRATTAGSRHVRAPIAAAPARVLDQTHQLALVATSVALALTGFAAMGFEIVWLRHLSLVLGQFRAVFSTVLTVVLIGIGVGSLIAGALQPRMTRPAVWLMAAQGALASSALLGIATIHAETVHEAGVGLSAALAGASPFVRGVSELWFNAKPVLAEVAVPALLMGFAFPIGNALVQHVAASVGQRAGTLYLANTVGAVAGSLVTGFALLPLVGIQISAVILAVTAIAAIGPLHLASRGGMMPAVAAVGLAGVAIALFLQLPSDFVLRRAQALPSDVLALSEGVNEVIAVTDEGQGALLWTNGHPMAGTEPLGQRYMRALAHIPLLAMDRPERALVIGFGVGNTAHAATLHPSVRHVEVAELSPHVLAHAHHFGDANHHVLRDRRLSVYVNDGRHHLLMQPPASYDLITLEPPPIAHAGVGALYSREFYALARTRLRAGGYLSQWLPVYQVPADTTLAMIRAFVDVFPQAVLLSGAKADLILVGTTAASIEVDPSRLALALAAAPDVSADLARLSLGSVRELVGTFIGSARTLAAASRDAVPVTDDKPRQEYSVRSLLNAGRSAQITSSSTPLIDLSEIGEWCPRCFADGTPVALVSGIDLYLTLLDRFYTAPGGSNAQSRWDSTRTIDGSAYLGAILTDSADVRMLVGTTLLNRGDTARAIEEFRRAVLLDAANAAARYHLATALLGAGEDEEALRYFREALPSVPNAAEAYNTLGIALVARRRLPEAVEQFRHATRVRPAFAEAWNNLGTALASQGLRAEAIRAFQQALFVRADYVEARRNLALVHGGSAAEGFRLSDRSATRAASTRAPGEAAP